MPNPKPPLEPLPLEDDRAARSVVYLLGVVWAVGVASTLIRAVAPLLLLLPIAIAGWAWRQRWLAQQRQQATLNTVFYRLLQNYEGRVTLLDLAMAAQVDAAVARQFLTARAQEFAAQFEVTEAGEILYLFPTLRSLAGTPALLSDAPPVPVVSPEADPGEERSLTQADLARRLGVSASTLSRKKLAADLTTWTRSRDPQGQGWAYLVQAQRFLRLD